MPVRITFGEKYWDEEKQSWDVQRTSSPDAPMFPNDSILEPKSNWRYVNYIVWVAMAEECGITAWLINNETGIIRDNESDVVKPLTENDYRIVNEAYLLRSAFAEGRPGWNMDDDELKIESKELGTLPRIAATPYDQYLARLMWLRFWLRWALDNCSEPSVVVSW